MRRAAGTVSFAMTLRRAFFLIHLTTGCLTGLVIFFLSLTGFLLAWQKPVIAWQERAYRSTPVANAAALPLDQLIATAAAAAGRRASAAVVHSDASAPVEIDFGREQRLFLNRYTGVVLGGGALRTRQFFDSITALHRWFGASQEHHAAAKTVKGVFTLALLLMILTGAYLWLPRTWNAPRLRAGLLLRFGRAGRARDWNWHNVVGFWAALPLTMIVLTGIVLSWGWATNLLYHLTGSPLPQTVRTTERSEHASHHRKSQPMETAAVGLQQILESAEHQAPEWQSLRIVLPDAADRTVHVAVDFANGGRPDQQAEMIFDRSNGAVLRLTTFSSLSTGRQLRSFMKYIHTGEAGGLAGETVAGLTALACCMLVWTGLSLALRRLRVRRMAAILDMDAGEVGTGVRAGSR